MIYEFSCRECSNIYEVLSAYDETGDYPNVVCPHCGSRKKERAMSVFAFSFADPVGTDRWNNSHDYRFKTKAPEKRAERALAEAASHMGSQPYKSIDDTNKYDTGVHDK